MEQFAFSFILIPVAALITGIGVYAWKREKPMWFWSGTTVSEEEITDVRAYNRANGIMWIAFSAVFWLSAVLGFMQIKAAPVIMLAGCFAGIPALVIAYGLIYKKYRAQK